MNVRKIFLLLLLIPAILFAGIPVRAADYNARAYILMEASTGTVLLEENADEALPPASVTKIMTLLLVMEAIADGKLGWDDMVQTSEYAASMGGSQVFLEPGEEMSVTEMVKCVVVSSANDAAVALAERVAGSEEAFVRRMNERAAELGMKNTVFYNTNGLDDDVDGHVSSARDIAIMSRELITKHPKILEFSSIWMDSIRNGAFGLTNTNRLVRFYRGANGLKTGSTAKAKFCISATAERGGMQLIAVVMAAPSRDERNEIAKKLLDYGFAGWETAVLTPELPACLPVTGGAEDAIVPEAEQITLLLAKGEAARITAAVTLPERIAAPVEAGEVLGQVDFMLDGKILSSVPITAQKSVKKLGAIGIFSRLVRRMILDEL
ncbi:MAG: D-alanyl-D-alanine carboxypeptidase [Clostridia bacterium]|nr:D-alanyl-D-alanine carboxypeptidase [Clostridia bacterium]